MIKEESSLYDGNFNELLYQRRDLLRNLIISNESERIYNIFQAICELISLVLSISHESIIIIFYMFL